MAKHTSPVVFDTLARLLSGSPDGLPDDVRRLKNWMTRAALFWLPIVPHQDLPRKISEEKSSWLYENAYLPFPVVAIEDRAGLVVLADKDVEDREVVRGAMHSRQFAVVAPLDMSLTDIDGFSDSAQLKTVFSLPEAPDCNKLMLIFGELSLATMEPTRLAYSGFVSSAVALKAGQMIRLGADNLSDVFNREALRNAGCGFQELFALIDPEMFILEESPATVKSNPFPKRKAWIAREAMRIKPSTERPIYTILKPGEIREKLGIPAPEPGHSSPRPHERRAHLRRLMSEKFTRKKGAVISVKSSWIGPHEAVRGNKRYRVLLDH